MRVMVTKCCRPLLLLATEPSDTIPHSCGLVLPMATDDLLSPLSKHNREMDSNRAGRGGGGERRREEEEEERERSAVVVTTWRVKVRDTRPLLTLRLSGGLLLGNEVLA